MHIMCKIAKKLIDMYSLRRTISNIFTIRHVSPHGRVPGAVCCSMDVMPLESGGGGMHGGCGIILASLLVFHRRA